MYWKNLKYQGYIPEPRAAHTCEKIGNLLYVFGGWNGEIALSNIEVFDIVKQEWSVVETSGENPSSRNNHSSCVAGNYLYIQGGHDGFNWLDDFYCLDTNNNHWKKIICQSYTPSERACHTLSIVGDEIYLFGGYDGKKSFNDIEVFNIKTNKWEKEIEYKGTPPSTRNAHTATVVESKIFILAGHFLNNHLNDLHYYDTNIKTWITPLVSGEIPKGVRGHTSTFYYNFIFIFGGFDGKYRSNNLYSLDLSDFSYTKIPIEPKDEILVRQRHTAILAEENKIYFFGGFEGSTWLNNIDVLKLNPLQEFIFSKKISDKLYRDYKDMLDDRVFSDVQFSYNINKTNKFDTMNFNVTDLKYNSRFDCLRVLKLKSDKFQPKEIINDNDREISCDNNEKSIRNEQIAFTNKSTVFAHKCTLFNFNISNFNF